MSEVKKVIITGYSDPNRWYRSHVGKIFEIILIGSITGNYLVKSGWIHKSDCQRILSQEELDWIKNDGKSRVFDESGEFLEKKPSPPGQTLYFQNGDIIAVWDRAFDKQELDYMKNNPGRYFQELKKQRPKEKKWVVSDELKEDLEHWAKHIKKAEKIGAIDQMWRIDELIRIIDCMFKPLEESV